MKSIINIDACAKKPQFEATYLTSKVVKESVLGMSPIKSK